MSMKVLTMLETHENMFGGASMLHPAGTQIWSGSTVGSQEEEQRRARAEKIDGCCGKDSDPSERTSTMARPEHVQSGRAWPKSALAPEPCCPSRGPLHHWAPL